MAIAHITQNTDKDYPCIQCGSGFVNIVREGPDPRLKCNNCSMMFDASQSIAAKEAGAIPDGPPKLTPTTDQVSRTTTSSREREQGVLREAATGGRTTQSQVPRTPSYVLITKDRSEVEFCTKKDFKPKLLKWTAQEKKFNVFELHPKQVTAKIDIN